MYISYRKEIYFRSVTAANPTEHLNVNDYSVLREKEMATYSSILAWRILWTEKPGGLLSIGSHRVGHDRSDLACVRLHGAQPPGGGQVAEEGAGGL